MRLNVITEIKAEDRLLLERLLQGDPHAVVEFFARMKDTIWTVCKLVALDDLSARKAYRAVKSSLQADGFARLRPFRSGRLDRYVALSAREILIDVAMKAEDQSSDRRWRHFERLFKRQITNIILQVCPDPAGISETDTANDSDAMARGARLTFKQMDIYQRLAVALSKDDCKVLRTYVAEGTLARSLRRMVQNAFIDQGREETWRPTLPNTIERLSPLDQLVFKAVYWERQDSDPRRLLSVIATRADPGLSVDAVSEALLRVRKVVGPGYSVRRIVPEEEGDREGDTEDVLAKILATEGAIEALLAAIEDLPERERGFARTYLEGSNLSRREAFGSDNYKLMRQIKTKLARALADVPAIACWLTEIKS